jgi:hypothetical protein
MPIKMPAHDTNNANKLIYPELSYGLTGLFFDAQNTAGRYAREKQYGDKIERRLGELKIPYTRELVIPGSGEGVYFLVDDKITVEIKAKRIIGKEDYYQLQRYLQILGIK